MADPFVIALDAIYNGPIGRDAAFSAILGETLRVVDKTAGEVVTALSGGAGVSTALPACMVRRAELTAHGITDPKDLVDTTVTFSGATWVIINYKSAPQPGGELVGEARLTLRKT
jgi:hypothetical protein